MSKQNEKISLSNLPEYFYYKGLLYNFVDNKVTRIEKDQNCPPTSLGLIPTDELSHRVNYLQGRILTIIDASFIDKDQKKAVKDLIKQVMFEEHIRLEDSATGFQTLSAGGTVQFSGSEEQFYKDNIK